MRKNEFLTALEQALSGLAEADVKASLAFYEEMISDRMEDGCTEEEAVAAVGSPETIAREIIAQTPLVRIVGERIKPRRRLATWEIVLLAVGSPLWASLGIAAFALVLSLYAVLWSVVVSLWAVAVAQIGSALGAIPVGVAYLFGGSAAVGLALLGASLVLAGVSVFAFFACLSASRGGVSLTKKIALGVKRALLKGGKSDE